MYNIGEVSKYLGISRDTLKFYESKGLINPKKNSGNGYREYDHFDIYDITTINFYREIDIEIKKIQEIKKNMSIENLEFLLQEKEQVILDEIEYKKLLLRKVQLINYNEYEILRDNSENLKKAVTLTALRRVISFNEEGMIGDKFIIVREVEDVDKDIEGEIIAHENCLYTIIEDGRWSTDGENIDNKVEASLRKIAIKNGYELLGVVYVNILLTTYEENLERVFLEIYAPIK